MRPTTRPAKLAATLAFAALVTACSNLTATPTLRPQAAYTARALGSAVDGPSAALDVSADGKVTVGYGANAEGVVRAFRHTDTTGLTDLGALGDAFSYALGVSADGGVVVGYSNVAWTADRGRPLHAFRHTPAGGLRDLGTLGGDSSFATGVSADGGAVVGSADTASGRTHAFRWTAAGGMAALGTLGGPDSYAFDVSADGGTVVGSSLTRGGQEHAFRWSAQAGMTDLGTLGGSESHAAGSSADGRVVVGSSDTARASPEKGARRAFLWTAAGGLQDLGTLGGATSVAHDVSADGQVVVGESDTEAAGSSHAFVWTRSGGMQDLGTLGGPNSSAQSVANGGVIVGLSDLPGGQPVATRWTPGGAARAHYRVDFETAPVNKILYSVRLGSGVVHTGGDDPDKSTVPVVGKRHLGGSILQAQAAKALWFGGSKRLTVVSPNTNTPAPQGGRLKLSFANYGPGGVTLNTLSVYNLVADGARLTLLYADGSSSRRPLERTATGASATVTLNAAGVAALDLFSPAPFALDDVTFTGD